MFISTLLLGLIIAYFWFILQRKPKKLPPGKWGWPIIGDLPNPSVSFIEEINKLREIHGGNLVSWRIGRKIHVFMSDYSQIKSFLSKPESTNKPDFFTFESLSLFKPLGILGPSGRVWLQNRRFTLHHLKELGMGKSYLGDSIEMEASALIDQFKKICSDQPQKLPWAINATVSNVLWKMVADLRYDPDNQQTVYFSKMINNLMLALDGPAKILDILDWLPDFIPTFIKRKLGFMEIQDRTKILTDYMEDIIKEHQKNFDEENLTNYIDAYLAEINKVNSEITHEDPIENLKMILMNLIFAGTDTTSATLKWSLIYMAKYPEIQNKVREEIDAVIPRHTLPSIQYKDQLPYFEATMNEIHRIVSLTPLSVPHVISTEMEFDGYVIPKGSLVSPNIYSCHTNPKYWERPDEFYPEHFLDEEGQFITKKEGYLPFAVGRRSCLGESLAKMEHFYFLGALVQNFTFSEPEGKEIKIDKIPKSLIVNQPPDVDLIIQERK